MQNKILILGAYGNFGKRISLSLTKDNYGVIISGRDLQKLGVLKDNIVSQFPNAKIEVAQLDANLELANFLKSNKPVVVINTIGPFQMADYSIAKTCINNQINYIDLSDGRDFVNEFSQLDKLAKESNVTAISGASTVPALSSAVIEHFKDDFSEIELLKFGIAPGQKAERGIATTKAILSYVGKKLKPCSGFSNRYGWQDLYIQEYPEIGARLMANCEIPDLDLFPPKYNIKKIMFSAGMENKAVHLGIWAFSWLVRIGLLLNLPKYASALLKMSNWFDAFGTSDGGMHIIIEGKDKNGAPLTIKWFILAFDGDGPFIPTIPSIILAKKFADGKIAYKGAYPCVGMISLEDYLNELKGFKVKTYSQSNAPFFHS